MTTYKQEEKKSDFKPVTINNFRERMLQEEKEEKVATQKPPTAGDTVIIEQGNTKPTASTTYPPTTTIRPLGALPAGLNPSVQPANGLPTAVGTTFSTLGS